MASKLNARPVTDVAEWERLFSAVRDPHLTQSWAYGEAKAAAVGWRTRRVVFDLAGWRTRRLVISADDEPVAICQVLDKCVGGACLASRLNRGPLFLEADPSYDVVRQVYRLLREQARRSHRPLVLAPALPDVPEFHHLLGDLGFRPRKAPGWCSDRVDLRPEEEQLYKNLHSSWRRYVNSAAKRGVEFRVCASAEDLEWIVRRHVEHAREKQYVGMNPAFLQALVAAAPREDFLVAQLLLHGERLGGMVCFRYGAVGEILILWLGSEGRRLNAGKYLDWSACPGSKDGARSRPTDHHLADRVPASDLVR